MEHEITGDRESLEQRKKLKLEELMRAGDELETAGARAGEIREIIRRLRRECFALGITQAEIQAALKEWEREE